MPCLIRTTAFVIGTVALVAACGGAYDVEEGVGASSDEIRVIGSFTSRGSGYYPSSSQLEGGFRDRIGKPLRTLQSFLAGDAAYVSVAMDTTAFRYGTRLRIKELEAKYGRPIIFRVVDTGGAFRGKGRSRIDICVANRSASFDSTINGTLHIDVIDERSGPPEQPTDPVDPSPTPRGSGRACAHHGTCNPGNDGSGEICRSGRCVEGCVSNAQCPGTKTCQSGHCD